MRRGWRFETWFASQLAMAFRRRLAGWVCWARRPRDFLRGHSVRWRAIAKPNSCFTPAVAALANRRGKEPPTLLERFGDLGLAGRGAKAFTDGSAAFTALKRARQRMVSFSSRVRSQPQAAARLMTAPATIQPVETPAPKRKRNTRASARTQHKRVMVRTGMDGARRGGFAITCCFYQKTGLSPLRDHVRLVVLVRGWLSRGLKQSHGTLVLPAPCLTRQCAGTSHGPASGSRPAASGSRGRGPCGG